MRDDASSGPYKSGFRAIMNLQCAIRQICGGGSTHLRLTSEMLCEERSRPFPTGRFLYNALHNALPPFNLPLTRWNAHCAPANLTG